MHYNATSIIQWPTGTPFSGHVHYAVSRWPLSGHQPIRSGVDIGTQLCVVAELPTFTKRVCVQLPTSAVRGVNVALPAFAAGRRAVAAPAVQQSIGISYPPGHPCTANPPHASCCSGRKGQTDGQTNGHRTVT